MIPTSSVTAMIIVAIASVLLPVAVVVAFKIKTKAGVSSVFVGALVFFVCFIIAVATQILFSSIIANAALLMVALCLRAGIVEEGGRYIAFSLLLKKKNKIGDALMYGAGHGGMEVILVLTLTMVSNIAFAAMLNNSGLDALIASAPGQAEAYRTTAESLIATKTETIYLGLAERVTAMIVHISLSVVAFYAVRLRKKRFYFLSVFMHAGFNAFILLLQYGVVGLIGIEAILFAAALVIAYVAWRFSRIYKESVLLEIKDTEPLPDTLQ